MPRSQHTLTLQGNRQECVILSAIDHHGHGACRCKIDVQSSGFSCQQAFNFDNDEYFLAKLREVLRTQSADAELLDMQSDNFLKIQAIDTSSLLVSGLILEERPFTQSMEFAFATDYEKLARFTSEFGRMLQANT